MDAYRRITNSLFGKKRQIVEEAVQPGASLSEVERRYGIAARILFRWKQELTPTAAPIFVRVQIADADARLSDAALRDEERAPSGMPLAAKKCDRFVLWSRTLGQY